MSITLTHSAYCILNFSCFFLQFPVTGMSFSHEDRSLFVLGSEAGGVFKCSMTSRGPPLTSKLPAQPKP